MIEVEFYYTTSRKWLIDFAASLSKVTGEMVSIQGSSLILPQTLGTGTFDFYQLGEGISVLITNCTFRQKIRLHRKAVLANDYHKILFNASKNPLIIDKANGQSIDLSSNFAEAVFFSSHSKGITITPGVGDPMRAVFLIFDRTWVLRHFLKHPLMMMVSRVKQFIDHEPLQFVSTLDAFSFQIVEEMLVTPSSHPTIKQYLKGCAHQLCALFFNNLIKEEVADDRIISAETLHLMRLKMDIESNLQKPLPSIEAAAELCLMSRTKFMSMFKTLYGKSFLNFFSELRLEKAKQLLAQMVDISEVATATGYSNLNYFNKSFKAHFGYAPLEYQKKRVES